MTLVPFVTLFVTRDCRLARRDFVTLVTGFFGRNPGRTKRSFEDEFFHSTNEDIWNIFDQLINDDHADHESSNSSKQAEGSGLKRLNSASFSKGLTMQLKIPQTESKDASSGFDGFKVCT